MNDGKAARKTMRSRTFCILATVCFIAIGSIAFGVDDAYAIVNRGTLSISMPAGVSVTTGDSADVSCAPSPFSDAQLPNCLTDYCPSGCDFYNGGCADADGQCTCNGGGYTTYYADCVVFSSNPSVARASWSDGTLHVVGYSAGECTIDVLATLRLWTDAESSIEVTVADAAVDPEPDPGSGTSTSTGTGTSASTDTGASANVGTGNHTDAAAAVVATTVSASGDGTTTVVNVDGSTASVDVKDATTVGIGDEGFNLGDALAALAGTERQLNIWGGADASAPDYIWQILGANLPTEADYHSLDLEVVDITSSNTALAKLLVGRTYQAFEFAQATPLPADMTLYVRTSKMFANGTYLNLYAYDATAGTFKKLSHNLLAAEGYASFGIRERNKLVLCPDDDLEQMGAVMAVSTTAAKGSASTVASTAAVTDDGAPSPAQSAANPWVFVAIGAAIVLAVAIALVCFRRRGAAATDATDAAATGSATETADVSADASADCISNEDNKTDGTAAGTEDQDA